MPRVALTAALIALSAAAGWALPKQRTNARTPSKPGSFIRAAGARGLLPRTIEASRFAPIPAAGPLAKEGQAKTEAAASPAAEKSQPSGREDPSSEIRKFVDVVRPENKPSAAGLRRAYEGARRIEDSGADGEPIAVSHEASVSRAIAALAPSKGLPETDQAEPVPAPKPAESAGSSREVKKLIAFFSIVYALQGIRATIGLPLDNLMLQHGLDELQATALTSVLMIPWSIKPVWGWLSDFVPVFGMRRKFWLIAASLITSAGYLWIAAPIVAPLFGLAAPGFAALTPAAIVAALFWTSFGVAIIDVNADALAVENGKRLERVDDFQNYSQRAKYAAFVVSAILGGALAQWTAPLMSVQLAAAVIAVAPLVTLGYSLFAIKESPKKFRLKKLLLAPRIMWENLLRVGWPRIDLSTAWKRAVESIRAVKAPDVLSARFWKGLMIGDPGPLPIKEKRGATGAERRMMVARAFVAIAAFTAFWELLPGAGTPMYYYKVKVLGFDQFFFGVLGVIGSAASFFGTIFYKRYFKERYTTVQLLRISMWVWLGLGLKNLLFIAAGAAGLGHWVTYPLAVVIAVVSSIVAIVPALVSLKLLAVVTPNKIAGTSFAAMASVMNISSTLAGLIGVWMFKSLFGGSLIALILATSAMSLVPLFLIRFLPSAVNMEPPKGSSVTIRGDLARLASKLWRFPRRP